MELFVDCFELTEKTGFVSYEPEALALGDLCATTTLADLVDALLWCARVSEPKAYKYEPSLDDFVLKILADFAFACFLDDFLS